MLEHAGGNNKRPMRELEPPAPVCSKQEKYGANICCDERPLKRMRLHVCRGYVLSFLRMWGMAAEYTMKGVDLRVAAWPHELHARDPTPSSRMAVNVCVDISGLSW